MHLLTTFPRWTLYIFSLLERKNIPKENLNICHIFQELHQALHQMLLGGHLP